MDPLRELRYLAERFPHFSFHRLEQSLGRSRLGIDHAPRELQVDRERDQVLLHTLVQLALEPVADRVGGQDQSLARGAQLRDLSPQLVEIGAARRRARCPDGSTSRSLSVRSSAYRSGAVKEPAPVRAMGSLPGAFAC